MIFLVTAAVLCYDEEKLAEWAVLGLSRRNFILSLLLGVLLCLSCGCGAGRGADAGELTVLTIGTADSGGTMFPVGQAIAQELSRDGLRINVGASSGSAMNLQNLLAGEVDLALVSGDAAYAAYTAPQDSGSSLRAIAAVFVSQSNWIAPASAGAVYVHDLKGLRLGVGPQDSSTELAAQIVIEALGLDQEGNSIQNCGLGSGADLLLDGELDALHGFAGIPINALTRAAEGVPCAILRYTQEELDAILDSGGVYLPVTLPANTYPGQDSELDTFGVQCLLCVDSSMDEELVYQLTQRLWNAREELSLAHSAMSVMLEDGFMNEELLLPLHDGAERFYQDPRDGGAQTSD